MSLNLFISAGEASSDLHASQLLREFKRLYPDVRAFGVGGKHLASEGMEVIVPSSQISAFGITDWLDRFGEIFAGYKKAEQAITRRQPDVALLLDLPDFNLKIASKLKASQIPTVYYFSPQVWAWRKYRVKTIKKLIDKMLVAFPFEKKFYEDEAIKAEFVGHPVLETVEPRNAFRTNAEIDGQYRIALLPGSRKSELRHHAPVLREVVRRLKQKYPRCEVRVPVASTLTPQEVSELFGKEVTYSEEGAHSIMKWADLALVASGTATLECAVIGTPFALFYRVSQLSYAFYHLVVYYKGPIGMPNILLGDVVAKEFVQEKFTVEGVFEEAVRLIENEVARRELGEKLLECREKLGGKGASQRAALHLHKLYLESVEKRKSSKLHLLHNVAEPA